MIKGREAGLLFAGQIDLVNLPNIPGRADLPKAGTLYFFYYDTWEMTDTDGVMPCSVLYYPGSSRAFSPRTPPANMVPVNNMAGFRQIAIAPRFDVEFLPYTTQPDDYDDAELPEDASTVFGDVWDQLETECLKKALGARIRTNSRADDNRVVPHIVGNKVYGLFIHHLLGCGTSDHAAVYPNEQRDKRLLLKLDCGDPGVRGNEGVFHFWIEPSALARSDFTQVELTC